MRFTRLIVTAIDPYWLRIALDEFCGYGTSVIGCDAEVGVEAFIDADQTPDGRPGASVLLFAFKEAALEKAVTTRCGQCLMTCATTAVYNGLPTEKRLALGKHLRFFGDGYQKSKIIDDRRYWRIPVMDGEFIAEEHCGVERGVAGGNFLIQSVSQTKGLVAARKAVDAIAQVPGVITPFPGGVVRSGSKVGSKYQELIASTNHAYCPTLVGRVESEIHRSANCVYEIVIDGTNPECVAEAMGVGIRASICEGIVAIGAGNYDGRLGKHLIKLHDVLEITGNSKSK